MDIYKSIRDIFEYLLGYQGVTRADGCFGMQSDMVLKAGGRRGIGRGQFLRCCVVLWCGIFAVLVETNMCSESARSCACHLLFGIFPPRLRG
eukprot:1365977-Amorphochlora_amoeboformis.AAC.1